MTWPVGPRGLSVLIFVALVALALAVVGWTQRHGGEVAPLPNYSSAGVVVHTVGGGTAG
jgi:hypothetical protein